MAHSMTSKHVQRLADHLGAEIQRDGGRLTCQFDTVYKVQDLEVPMHWDSVDGLVSTRMAALLFAGPGDLNLVMASGDLRNKNRTELRCWLSSLADEPFERDKLFLAPSQETMEKLSDALTPVSRAAFYKTDAGDWAELV